ncbi:hypothetical protein Bealeia1_01956 (plasmid) [Candidatus Bealeia paramacronuclearis]|uniref:Uncharacterized protein n=1 Tax=Candidatus Bealeia paramacronuclearis TaxID=1921001 RepID=A0ABZ2CBR2_9PROT|nr:hypothetical protein [Candidatus Bealeia paramacronuclearis]
MNLPLPQRLVHAPVFESFTPQRRRPHVQLRLVRPAPTPEPQVTQDSVMDLMTARVTQEIKAQEAHQARLAQDPAWQELKATLARRKAELHAQGQSVLFQDDDAEEAIRDEDDDHNDDYHQTLRENRADYYASIHLSGARS